MSSLRRRLAHAIERAFREQHDMHVVVNPDAFVIAKGYWRSCPVADTYRWEISCRLRGTQVGPRVYSYDTMTACAKGVVIDRDAWHHLEYDATAQG